MARNKQEDRLSALVRSTERDTWEKGQQAGRWLSQHMYSEKEKREMEKKRRAQQRKAQAAQPESAPEESAPGGAAFQAGQTGAGQQGQKPTPATGVSAQQNAAWQAAADGDGQAPAWVEEFLQMPFSSTMDENMAALAQQKTPAQIAREDANQAQAYRDSQYRASGQYGSRGGTGPGDTRTNAQKRAGVLLSEANMAQQRAFQTNAYANQLEAEEAAASEAIAAQQQAQEEAQQAQAAAQQAQEEAAARQNPQRKEYWAEQWRSYGQQLDEAKRNGAPQETMYELEAQRGEAYQNYMRLSGQETVARSEQQARQKELAQQAQAQAQQQAPQAGQGSSEIEAAIQQTGQALTDVRLKIADLRAAGAEYAPGGGYSEPFQAALDEEARLESQLDAQQAQAYQQAQASVNWGTLWGWASPDYEMTDAQKAVAAELVEQWNGTIGPKFDEYYETARRLHALGQSTDEVEMLLLQAEIMDALATKVSGVRSAFSGAGNALPLVPQMRGALEAENWRRAGFEGENPLGVAQRSQSAAGQNPVQYGLGYGLSSAAQYALAGRLMQAVPGVSGALDDVANAIAATGPAQKLQTVPVLGQLATPEAIRGMAADAMLDFGLGTVPQAIEQAGSYARQLTQGVRPGEQVLTPGSIWGNALQNTGAGLLANAAGELAPAALGALDSVLHGRPVLNAAQQQGFEAMRQGMAPSANQQAELHSLWGEAPGYVPVQQGGWGEFLSAPAADAADGFRSGPLALGAAQDAGEAAQRQAFLKWTQGEAMTAQEKQLVDDLWNSDPAKASEYWAAGEFLDTEVPGASSLDGGGFDGTMKSEAAASPTGQRTPFDYLQDGKGWEEPSETVNRANIAAFENGEKTFNDVVDDYAILYAEKVNSNRTWRWKEISNAHLTRPQKRKVNQRAVELGKIPEVLKKPGTNYLDFERSGLIYKIDGKPVIFSLPQECWQWSDDHQFALLDSWLPGGKRPEGYMWHHSEQTGRMELVPFGIHNVTSHVGGRASGMWAAGKR